MVGAGWWFFGALRVDILVFCKWLGISFGGLLDEGKKGVEDEDQAMFVVANVLGASRQVQFDVTIVDLQEAHGVLSIDVKDVSRKARPLAELAESRIMSVACRV